MFSEAIFFQSIAHAKPVEVCLRLTLEQPGTPLNLKAPMPHTTMLTGFVGKGLPTAEVGVHTRRLGSA